MKKIILILPLLIIAGIFFYTCQQPTQPDESTSNNALFQLGNTSATYDLYAGQDILVGYVEVSNDETNLEIKFVIDVDGWCLGETHVAVAKTLEGIPQTKKGNPIPGQFTYKDEDPDCIQDTYTIPLDEIYPAWACDDNLVIAAHAVVNNDVSGDEETAWGAESEGEIGFEGNNWATYFNYTIKCSEDPTPSGCETAFAYSGNDADCFQNFGFSRWGWSIGPISSGSNNQYAIWAGAGQCDLSKGTLVGTLTIDYVGSTATITYTMDNGYTMDETHLYVGNARFPLNNSVPTVAPGQYPYQHDLSDATTDSYTVNGLSGDIYVIAHAVVCGF